MTLDRWIAVVALVVTVVGTVLTALRYRSTKNSSFSLLSVPKSIWRTLRGTLDSVEEFDLVPSRIAGFTIKIGEHERNLFSRNGPASEAKLSGIDQPGTTVPHLLVDIENAEESWHERLSSILQNRDGLILFWSKEWEAYRWTFPVFTEWATSHRECPVLLLNMDGSDTGSFMKKAGNIRMANRSPDSLASSDPADYLLKKATLRQRQYLNVSHAARATITFSLFIVLAMALLSTSLFIGGQKMKGLQASLNPYAIADLLNAARKSEEIARTVADRPQLDLEPEQAALLLRYYEDFLRDLQSGIEGQVDENFELSNIEATIFIKVDSLSGQCYCEALYERDGHECFKFDSSVISCAMENRRVAHWKASKEQNISIRTLSGEKDDLGAECTYVPASRIERKEILCLPIGTRIDPQADPMLGLCISHDESTGNLEDRGLNSKLTTLGLITAAIPWNWYTESAAHLQDDVCSAALGASDLETSDSSRYRKQP